MMLLAVLFGTDVSIDEGILVAGAVLVFGAALSLVGWALIQIVALRSANITQLERTHNANLRMDRIEKVVDRLEDLVNELRAAGLIPDRRQ